MKVLLISANREEINMRAWPLGLACVAESIEKAGHLVHLLDIVEAQDYGTVVKGAVEDFNPDIIGISVRNIDDQHMIDTKVFLNEIKGVVEACRKVTRSPIVLGGAGYSMYPETLLKFVEADMGIQGEGEAALLFLLDRFQQQIDLHGIPGLYLPDSKNQASRSFIKDLDSIPLPNIALLPHSLAGRDNFWLPVQTRRGCPMKCSYCSTAAIEGTLLRVRSPDLVTRWLAGAEQAGFKQYYFVDNTFNLPPSYAKRLCKEIIAVGLNIVWRCILYPVLLDPELVGLMATAGCREVSLGFESGSELILHAMNKRFTPNEVRQASNLLAEHGIKQMGFLLLGGPGETRSSALESFTFADSLNLESLRLTVGIRIYPLTQLAAIAERDGMISPGDDLLRPRFYVEKGLENWLKDTANQWLSARPHWFW